MTTIISDIALLERSMETFPEEMQIPDNGFHTTKYQKTSEIYHAPKKQQILMETSQETQ